MHWRWWGVLKYILYSRLHRTDPSVLTIASVSYWKFREQKGNGTKTKWAGCIRSVAHLQLTSNWKCSTNLHTVEWHLQTRNWRIPESQGRVGEKMHDGLSLLLPTNHTAVHMEENKDSCDDVVWQDFEWHCSNLPTDLICIIMRSALECHFIYM